MSNKKEEAARLAAAALDPALAPRLSRRPPRLAMSAVTDFTGELERVEKDLDETKKKLALYDGALPVRTLRPEQIRPSRFANRISLSFEGPAFHALKEDIRTAGINVQPIKVRPVGQDEYEVVFGHRRHRACLELGLGVSAVIQEDMSDKELFEEMSRENDRREDLSAYELALHYRRAIDLKLYKNWSELAAVLGKTKGLVSRYSALADLPRQVVEAFSNPNEIQPKWAEKLRQVLEADAPAVLQAAKQVRGKALPAKEVFQALLNEQTKQFTRVNFHFGHLQEDERAITVTLQKRRLTPEQMDGLRAFLESL
ncbi:ParB/RepB/Spo0J family partition protein [Chitinasiproducens palmae]|uniref:Chromosome partitioning protein, ParB family n=1 Tax=Chitinasiproducens palmae TaxID=1770053 RepID=A0A1H2PQ78_9BURK|nr:ParB/RepB/Spo0J family partition protein [Chitinasiproducens palmae]SDV48889.1 chromosome partitioning protein, ParB family [Chitinasiproducens palmae]